MDDLTRELYLWLLLSLRASGVILLLPGLPGRPWPTLPRVALAACLGFLLCGRVDGAAVPATTAPLVLALAGELALGLTLGFVSRKAFYAMEMGGRLIAMEIGLTAAPGVDSPTFDQEPVAGLLQLLAIALFFTFGGHLWVLGAFARSFAFAPAGRPALSSVATEAILQMTAQVISGGLRLAAPFLVLHLLLNLTFGLLGKVAPRLNVFMLSFGVINLVGLYLFAGAGLLFAHFLYSEFFAIPRNLGELLPLPTAAVP